MYNRRKFIQTGALFAVFSPFVAAANPKKHAKMPIVISTWDAGIRANKGAWEVLKKGGKALDAVEKGVMVTEDEIGCCVGLGGNPDRDGFVTLDACIMDEKNRCGGVAMLQHIKHPISVARKVMEDSPHVLLVGEGAYQFAIEKGFKDEWKGLSPDAKKGYKEWLKTSKYSPVMNIENKKGRKYNHDTIGMVALDAAGNLSGSCTTSGMAYKLHGRVGDSPIIGSGLFVDNEVGAAVATGVGEEVVRIAGTHLVVELMRNGKSPQEACKLAIERLVKKSPSNLKEMQVCFIALNNKGEYGSFALQKGFMFALCDADDHNVIIDSDYFYK